jgi:hypothetical protein
LSAAMQSAPRRGKKVMKESSPKPVFIAPLRRRT